MGAQAKLHGNQVEQIDRKQEDPDERERQSSNETANEGRNRGDEKECEREDRWYQVLQPPGKLEAKLDPPNGREELAKDGCADPIDDCFLIRREVLMGWCGRSGTKQWAI